VSTAPSSPTPKMIGVVGFLKLVTSRIPLFIPSGDGPAPTRGNEEWVLRFSLLCWALSWN
jgi:hypothetical protein